MPSFITNVETCVSASLKLQDRDALRLPAAVAGPRHQNLPVLTYAEGGREETRRRGREEVRTGGHEEVRT